MSQKRKYPVSKIRRVVSMERTVEDSKKYNIVEARKRYPERVGPTEGSESSLQNQLLELAVENILLQCIKEDTRFKANEIPS